MLKRKLLIVLLGCMLAACGGGGGADGSSVVGYGAAVDFSLDLSGAPRAKPGAAGALEAL